VAEVDEKKLADLFQDAAADAPPPTFDSADVAGAARRADARRRSLLLGSSSLAVVLVAVGLMIGFLDLGHTGGGGLNTAAGPPAASQASRHEFDAATPGHPHAGALNGAGNGAHTGFPGSPPTQGGGTPGEAGPSAGTAPSGCGPTDGELADALAGELPSAGVTDRGAATVPGCPAGARAASYLVHDGPASGRISVVLTPAGQHPATPAGYAIGTATAASGHELTVLSAPAPGSPAAPLAGRVQTMAQALAAHF
jgi:hypothetical protein